MTMGWEFWFAGATLMLAIFGWGIRITNRITDANKKRDEMAATKYTEFHSKISAMRREFVEADDEVRKMAGEIGHSTQSKVQQLELWVRDQLVLKSDYREDVRAMTDMINALGTRIEKRLDTFDDKLNSLQDFNMTGLRDKH